MLLYGASGHAKVIISCLEANHISVEAIFDDDETKTSLWTIPVVGSYKPDYLSDNRLIISVGYNRIRKQISHRIAHPFGQVIHPQAIVDRTAIVGAGSVIFHRAVVQADTRIGRHVILNTGASVDHDCVLEDFVHVAPQATLCGGICVGEGTLVGAGAVVLPNLTIGRWATIAAGAVVTRSVPDFAVVRGNPGRVIKIEQVNEH